MSKKEKSVTIVCCYNDDKQYQRLKNSLAKQNMEYELIGIANQGNVFSSCSSALNSVLDQVRTGYLIFSHQDIELPEPDMLERFVDYMEQIGEADILGVAGAAEKDSVLKSDAVSALWQKNDATEQNSVLKGDAGRQIGDKDGTCVLSYVKHGTHLACAGEVPYEGIAECDTVDECFFGGRTKSFMDEPLDEKLCNSWHLYAVERCLRARAQGNHVWVCDLPLNHYSTGKIDHAYNANFRQIAKYYAKYPAAGKEKKEKASATGRIKWIRTACGSTRIDWLHRNLFYIKRELLIRMKRY